jgi:hypothetical protein
MPSPPPMTPPLPDPLGFNLGAATGTLRLDLTRSGTSDDGLEGPQSTRGPGLPTEGPRAQARGRSGDQG